MKSRVFVIVFLTLLSLFISCSAPTHAATAPGATAAVGQAPHVFLLNAAILQNTKRAITRDPILQASLKQLEAQANALLTAQTVSVTEKTQIPIGGTLHDYYSLAPYWWPNPDTANHLPYVQRDGQVNPEINTIPDKANLNKMVDSVQTLALAYYFAGNKSYAAKAADFLRTWFLDSATAMNPNMNYAQAIKGIRNGGPEGIIEARGFAEVVDAIGLIQPSPAWKAQDQRNMQNWFSQYLTWLRTSSLGQQEAAAANNHSTWYDMQAAAIALFANQTSIAQSILQASGSKHVDGHILADGSQPQELTRTLSWHYSVFNLQALFGLASLGDNVKVDLWDYKNPQGPGLQTALNYVLPAALGKPWPHQQITALKPSELVGVLYQAAAHYHQTAYRQAIRSIEGSSANNDVDNLLYGDA